MIKMAKMKDLGLYFITDRKLSKNGIIKDVGAAVRAGIKIVQYREKELDTKRMVDEAFQIKQICDGKAVFLINDRVDVALAVNADGIHIGSEDMPYEHARKLLGKEKIIGLSSNSFEESLHNQELGADYTSIGPIFYTATKKDAGSPIGLEPIKKLTNELQIPFVAIGGINEYNVDEVLKAGAKNVAIISAIVAKDNVGNVIKEFMKKINHKK